MDGPCESNNSSPKWQNLKFAEISVWKRVSAHLQDFFNVWLFGYFSPKWRGVFSFLWMPTRPHSKQAEVHA